VQPREWQTGDDTTELSSRIPKQNLPPAVARGQQIVDPETVLLTWDRHEHTTMTIEPVPVQLHQREVFDSTHTQPPSLDSRGQRRRARRALISTSSTIAPAASNALPRLGAWWPLIPGALLTSITQ
jgi:hypothetical protein